jgi:signal peptidase II
LQERRAVAALRGAGGTRRRHLPLVLATAAAVVGLDQATKSLAVHFLRSGPVHLVGTLDLQLTYNSGVAFSLASGHGPVVVVVGILILAVLVAFGRSAATRPLAASIGLIAGGAASNLADRLFRPNGGSVVDFVDLHFWPTFNLADASIVIGAVWLVILLALGHRHT